MWSGNPTACKSEAGRIRFLFRERSWRKRWLVRAGRARCPQRAVRLTVFYGLVSNPAARCPSAPYHLLNSQPENALVLLHRVAVSHTREVIADRPAPAFFL